MTDEKPKRNLTHERLRKFLEQRKQSEIARASRHALPNAIDPQTGKSITRVELVTRQFDAQLAALPGAPKPAPSDEPIAEPSPDPAPPALDPNASLGLRASGKSKASR